MRCSACCSSPSVRCSTGAWVGRAGRWSRPLAGDGGYGWPEEAPFDAIVVTAAAPEVPQPLIAQLADGAPLVAPIGPAGYQELVRLTKQGQGTNVDHLVPVAFVPLVGEHGWREQDST